MQYDQAMVRLLLSLTLFLSCLPVTAQTYKTSALSNTVEVIPSATDPQISTFNDAHVCWLPAAASRNQLLVFLPGTYGVPKENFPFAVAAAALGFHVISLMYPDNVAAQQVCPNSNDPNAYMKFRLAIIQGGDYNDLHVSQADSIENRLTKLLAYLGRTQPEKGWEQFLNRQGQVEWSKVVVSGQSQGGGHAYVIGKIHPVARVLTFGSPKDYSFYFKRPANGFDSNTQTPLNRFFAFNHNQDTAGACNHEMQMEIFRQIRLTDQGMVEVDNSNTNFQHAHLIFTSAPVPNMTNQIQYHGSVISGALQFDPQVWTYMLTEPVK